MPKTEAVVLFAHHKNDEVTQRHFRILQKTNPELEIVPVRWSWEYGMPNALALPMNDWVDTVTPSLISRPCPTPSQYSMDAILYAWFKARHFDAERYIFLEYDTYAPMPLREFYAPVWDWDYFAPHIVEHGDKRWSNFRFATECVKSICGDRLIGQWPLCGALISHQCLNRMVQVLEAEPHLVSLFCEARMPTLANMSGFKPRSHEIGKTIDWRPSDVGFKLGHSVYHPIKS